MANPQLVFGLMTIINGPLELRIWHIYI